MNQLMYRHTWAAREKNRAPCSPRENAQWNILIIPDTSVERRLHASSMKGFRGVTDRNNAGNEEWLGISAAALEQSERSYFPGRDSTVYEFSATRLTFVYEIYFLVCEDLISPLGQSGAPACSQVGPNTIPTAFSLKLARSDSSLHAQ